MKSYFILPVLLSQFLLQSINVFAQTTQIEGTNIAFTLPNTSWKLAVSNKNSTAAFYGYQRESMAGDNTKPSISFMVESIADRVYINDYLLHKLQASKIKPVKFYSEKMGKVDGRLCKAVFATDTVYMGCINNGLKPITVICEAKAKSFGKYEEEFLGMLASLKFNVTSKTESNINTTGNSNNTAENTTSKTAIAEKGAINSCDYFPVKNGMKFTYTRNDMAGEHRIVESYTAVADKAFKSGKIVKGYKINTTVANRNNTIIYYYCDKNSMKMYSEMPAYNTHIGTYVEDNSIFPSDYNKPDYQKTPVWETEKYGSGKYLNFTELKAGNIGTEWTDIQVVNDNLVFIHSKIIGTGLALTVQGKSYSPVMHVERSVTIKFQGENKLLNTQDIYYAKGVGKIKVIENGNDLLMGTAFTTTQELVSYNVPAAN